jgi:hypothetical protein
MNQLYKFQLLKCCHKGASSPPPEVVKILAENSPSAKNLYGCSTHTTAALIVDTGGPCIMTFLLLMVT